MPLKHFDFAPELFILSDNRQPISHLELRLSGSSHLAVVKQQPSARYPSRVVSHHSCFVASAVARSNGRPHVLLREARNTSNGLVLPDSTLSLHDTATPPRTRGIRVHFQCRLTAAISAWPPAKVWEGQSAFGPIGLMHTMSLGAFTLLGRLRNGRPT